MPKNFTPRKQLYLKCKDSSTGTHLRPPATRGSPAGGPAAVQEMKRLKRGGQEGEQSTAMAETRCRLVNRPEKFEDLWFKAFGQPSARGRGWGWGMRQLEGVTHQPAGNCGGHCTTFGEASCIAPLLAKPPAFPHGSTGHSELVFGGRGATRLGRVSGH